MKKYVKKAITTAFIFVLVLAILTGCGTGAPKGNNNVTQQGTTKSQTEKINLRYIWWGSQNRHDRTLKVIDMYTKENPNLTISPEFTGGDQIGQRLATLAAANDLPDILQMDLFWMEEYVERNLLLPLKPYIDSGVLNLDDVSEPLIDTGRVNGEVYAICIGTTAIAMVVDPEMYAKAGEEIPEPGYTWDDFIAQAYRLKEKLGDDIYVRGMPGPHEFRQICLPQYGQSFFNEDGTGLGYDDQYLIDWFTMWKKLIDEGVLPGPEITSAIQGLEDEMIVHGKSPNHADQQPRVVFNSNQFVALSLAADRPLEMVMYPSLPDKQKATYLKASQLMSIAARTEYPEEVAKFIDYFTNSIEANEVLEGERGVPISSKVREHLYNTSDEPTKKTFEYIDFITQYSEGACHNPPGTEAVLKTYHNIYEQMAFGQITPEEAALKFRREAEEILSKNKK